MPSPDKVLYILTGCTAVGKTEWALRWAEAHRAEIVSCDSVLFYRGMDIGTAKPTVAERARVPHHLIDIVEVDQPFDVIQYSALARKAVDEIAAKGKPVFPDGLGTLDVHNPRRVTRALERCLATGLPLNELLEKFQAKPGPFADYRIQLTRIDRDRAELQDRIVRRIETMLKDGLIDEVRRLRAHGLEKNPSAAKAIGYRETLAHLDGVLSEPELGPAITTNTVKLVKKQQTWFRTQLPQHLVLPAEQVSLEALFPETRS